MSDDFALVFILLIVFWMAVNWAGALIAKDKGLYDANFVVSLLIFGPFALFVLLAYKPNLDKLEQKKVESGLKKWCVYCGGSVPVRAVKCGHCGSNMPDHN